MPHSIQITNAAAHGLNQIINGIPGLFTTPSDIKRSGAVAEFLPEEGPNEKAWMQAPYPAFELTDRQFSTIKAGLKTAVAKGALTGGKTASSLLSAFELED